jgi:hypothetical protein
MPDEQSGIVDWMNLPHGVLEVSLWAGLHDAQIVSIQSNLLERTVTLHLEAITCLNSTNCRWICSFFCGWRECNRRG